MTRKASHSLRYITPEEEQPLKEQLQLLARLQEIDHVIDQHENELTRLPLEIQDIARGLVILRREIAENKEKLEAIEKDLRKSEQNLAWSRRRSKRSERRLLGIKNQKEYNALSREVKLGKKVVGEIEDAILGFMSETESLKKPWIKKKLTTKPWKAI